MPAETIEIVVVGAHLSGMPLNAELTRLGATFRRAVATTADYRFYALAGGPPKRPGLLRVADGTGAPIETEVWALPPEGFGRFVAGIPAPLSIGTVRLSDGATPKGFLVEPEGLAGAKDITALGGWRAFIAASSAAAAGLVAAPSIVRAQAARTVKMGSLRLIHSMTPHFYEKFAPSNLKIEIITFDSPTDGKNAVVTKSVDFGGFGIAAATLGAAAGEPVVVVGAFCNKGMGVIAKAGSDIKSVKDLKGKKVGIWPGSTQEVFIMERLRLEGMSIRDVQATRVPFGEMHAMLSRGDIDAYVGAEPGPGLSLATGVGQLVEYPYGTAMGGLNMIFATHEDTVAKDPELVRTMLGVHRKASEFMMANKAAVADMTVAKLGANRAAVDKALAADNVEYTWELTDTVLTQARTYARQMQELKQNRALPDFAKFLNPTFSKAVAGA